MPFGAGGSPGGLARTGATAGRAAGLGWHRPAGVQQGCSPGACTEATASSYRPAMAGQCRGQLFACKGRLLMCSLHMLLLSHSWQGCMCCPLHMRSPSPQANIQPAAHCQCLIVRCSKLSYGAISSSSHAWPAGCLPASDRPVQGAAQPPCSGGRCLWTSSAAASTRGCFEQPPSGVRLLDLLSFRAGSNTHP